MGREPDVVLTCSVGPQRRKYLLVQQTAVKRREVFAPPIERDDPASSFRWGIGMQDAKTLRLQRRNEKRLLSQQLASDTLHAEFQKHFHRRYESDHPYQVVRAGFELMRPLAKNDLLLGHEVGRSHVVPPIYRRV